MKIFSIVIMLLFFPISLPALAGETNVIEVAFKNLGDNTFQFDVTLKHTDEGWEHYANKWDVVAPDGTILGIRVLFHPHVNEQPFTRSLSGVKIPSEIHEVTIRAHDSVHKYGGKVINVKLSSEKTSQ